MGLSCLGLAIMPCFSMVPAWLTVFLGPLEWELLGVGGLVRLYLFLSKSSCNSLVLAKWWESTKAPPLSKGIAPSSRTKGASSLGPESLSLYSDNNPLDLALWFSYCLVYAILSCATLILLSSLYNLASKAVSLFFYELPYLIFYYLAVRGGRPFQNSLGLGP